MKVSSIIVQYEYEGKVPMQDEFYFYKIIMLLLTIKVQQELLLLKSFLFL